MSPAALLSRRWVGLCALAGALALTACTASTTADPESTLAAVDVELGSLAAAEDWNLLSKRAAALGERLAGAAHRDTRVFGSIATYRALADVMLQRKLDAIWHWQVALNFDSDRPLQTIEKYPVAVTALAGIGRPSIQVRQDRTIRPASPTKTTRPDFLAPADSRRAPQTFGVQIVVGTDGIPHSPQLVGEIRDDADRAYSALEALRRWRFSPATAEGNPVEIPMSFSFGEEGRHPPKRRRRL